MLNRGLFIMHIKLALRILRREIGIQKVLGASAGSIMLMFNSVSVKLVFLAIILSIPLSWWVMQNWLNSFAYRININPLIFIV